MNLDWLRLTDEELEIFLDAIEAEETFDELSKCKSFDEAWKAFCELKKEGK